MSGSWALVMATVSEVPVDMGPSVDSRENAGIMDMMPLITVYIYTVLGQGLCLDCLQVGWVTRVGTTAYDDALVLYSLRKTHLSVILVY